jgi:K+-transporting ATPase A subunit
MTVGGWLQIILVLALVVGLACPLGHFIAEAFEGRRSFLSAVLTAYSGQIDSAPVINSLMGGAGLRRFARNDGAN